MSKFLPNFLKRQEQPAPLAGESVQNLIEKLSPEDTQTLLKVLSSHENLRMVSTPEAKAMLEDIVKGGR